MNGYLIYTYRRWRLIRRLNQIDRAYVTRHGNAVIDRCRADSIEKISLSHGTDRRNALDDLAILDTDYLWRQAEILDVEMPPFSDDALWQRTFVSHRHVLNINGRRAVRETLRAEKKSRSEAFRTWLPLALSVATAVVGAGAAWAAVLWKR